MMSRAAGVFKNAIKAMAAGLSLPLLNKTAF
jgi:hypothetical protein